MFVMIPYPKAKLMQKKNTPMQTAMLPTIITNLCSSLAIGVSPFSAVWARFAICPITVSSPVLKTIPYPFPLVHYVPKKATLGLSKIFFSHFSGILSISSDSPVREALLTFISIVWMRIVSAGMFSPKLISIISPGTSSIALIYFYSPSLKTRVFFGMKFLN
jgi:hypothetical protein